MNPLVKLLRTNHGDWEERRFLNAIAVRTVTGWKAIERDIEYLKAHGIFPSTGDVTYVPYIKLIAP